MIYLKHCKFSTKIGAHHFWYVILCVEWPWRLANQDWYTSIYHMSSDRTPSPNDHLRNWISKMQGFLGLLAGFEGSSHWSDWFCDSRLAAWVSIGTVKKQCCFKTTYIILYTVFDQILSQPQVSTAAHFRVVPPMLSNFQFLHHFPTPTAPLGQAGPVSLRPTRRSCSEAPRGPSCWTHRSPRCQSQRWSQRSKPRPRRPASLVGFSTECFQDV